MCYCDSPLGVLMRALRGLEILHEVRNPIERELRRIAKRHEGVRVPGVQPEILRHGKRAITADTDLRLCKFFGLSDGYWLRAQAAYDTEVAQDELRDALKHIKPWSGLGRQPGHTA